MSVFRVHCRFTALALAALAAVAAVCAHLVLVLPARTAPLATRPMYWVAVLSVDLKESEKATFQTKLHLFSDDIMNLLGPDKPRALYSQQPCMKAGKQVPNCERLELFYEPGEPLKLMLQEQEDGPMGVLNFWTCGDSSGRLSFVECFEARRKSMEEAVRDHDRQCHPVEGAKSKCVVKDKTFVPTP
jgi:hypothetical protein